MYIPRFIPYPVNQVIDDANKLIITGQNFDPSFTYYWVFKYGLSTLKEIKADYIDVNSVKCRPLDFEYESFIDLQIKAVFGSTTSFAYGTISIFLYEMPIIQKIFPAFSAYDQGVEVSVTIDSLPYIQNVHCKFGSYTAALVTIYRQGKQIIWKAPVISSINSKETVKIQVSVDNQYWYESEQDFVFYAIPTFTGVDNLLLPLFGRKYIAITGTNFYNTQDLLVCRLKITANEYYDLKVQYISSTELRCLNPPVYLTPTTGVELSVSFNRLSFYPVVSNLEYKNVPKVFLIDKIYGSETPNSNIITVTGEGFTGATINSVGGFIENIPFTAANDTSGTFELPPFANISSITGRPYTYMWYFDLGTDISKYCTTSYKQGKTAWWFIGSNTMFSSHYMISKEKFGWVCIDKFPKSQIEVGIFNLGYSINSVSYQYFELPNIIELNPKAIFKNTVADVLVKGTGFWDTNNLGCRLRTTSATVTFSLLTTTFINSTTIKCNFPPVSDTSVTYEIGVTLNGYEYTKEASELLLSVNDPLVIYSVFPIVMFKNSENVQILVRAAPLNSLLTYFWVVHEFFIEGVIYTDAGGLTYIKCNIPSYQAIANSAVIPIPANGEVAITLSAEGVVFPSSGITFRFLNQDQVNGVTPLNGPDTGGTTITITLSIDQSSGSIGDVYCVFYSTVSVLAVSSPPFDYKWVTPALDYSLCKTNFDWNTQFSTS